MTTQEQFLEKHNSMAPTNLKATINILNIFKEEKPGIFKSEDWPIDKIRRPFIFWLTSYVNKKN